jgi:hypothetical protein
MKASHLKVEKEPIPEKSCRPIFEAIPDDKQYLTYQT